MRRVLLTIVAVALFAGAGAVPAHAAAPGVAVSGDGVAFAASLATPILSPPPSLVPMQSVSRDFWVRNEAAVDAYLMLTVANPTWTDLDYATALDVTARTPGATGAPVGLTMTASCPVLLHGVALAAGEVVKVTTTLSLGDLDATGGQGATAGLDIAVTLTEAVGSAPGVCASPAPAPAPTPDVVVVLVPAVTGDTPATAQEGTTEAGEPAAPPTPFDPIAALFPNTLGSFDAAIVLLAMIAVPLGAAVFLLLGLRRRADDDEADTSAGEGT